MGTGRFSSPRLPDRIADCRHAVAHQRGLHGRRARQGKPQVHPLIAYAVGVAFTATAVPPCLKVAAAWAIVACRLRRQVRLTGVEVHDEQLFQRCVAGGGLAICGCCWHAASSSPAADAIRNFFNMCFSLWCSCKYRAP